MSVCLHIRKTLWAALPAVLLLAACADQPTPRALSPGERPLALATTLPLACIGALVAGEDAVVELLPQENTDPHTYEPTANDRRRLQRAHLLLVNGLGFETFDAAAVARAAGATLVDCSAAMDSRWLIAASDDGGHRHNHGHGHAHYDPHVWLCARGAALQARAIARALGVLDPARAEAYGERAATLERRLSATLDEFKPRIEALKNRKFATDHDAFAYFAREAGLEEAVFIRKAPGRQITVERRRKLEDELSKSGVKAIFVEPGHDDAAAREIARSVGAALAVLDPFEIGKFEPAAFERVYRSNLQTVLDALSD